MSPEIPKIFFRKFSEIIKIKTKNKCFSLIKTKRTYNIFKIRYTILACTHMYI